jgi:hypothetical protein
MGEQDSNPRVEVDCKELTTSIVCTEILPLISGSVIAALGYKLWIKHSTIAGIFLLVVGLLLLLRSGVIINSLKICYGKRPIRCHVCCFKLDPDRYWRHPFGFEVPVTQCILPITAEMSETRK